MKLKSLFFVVLMGVALSVAGQSAEEKKAAAIAKLEVSLKKAQEKVAALEKKSADADSLVDLGNQMKNEAKVEIKAAQQQLKIINKEFSAERKPLAKLTGSKDRAVAAQAKADLKELENQFKADVKAATAEGKAAEKKLTTGDSNVAKGKSTLKSNAAALKTAQASADLAQDKYDIATGNAAPAKGKKKK